jgi:hydroxymethylpyrimidine/phosphomethylpyrimidine kinase
MEPPPIAITIAGSDSSAGAGIQADLKTFTYFHVFGQSVVTCVVAEVPGKVETIQPISVRSVQDQLRLSLDYYPVRSIKTGMLYSKEIISAVCDILEAIPTQERPPIVVDPVMVASAGDPLLEPDAIAAYRDRLFPIATVVTPNLYETEAICGHKIQNFTQLAETGAALVRSFGSAFLLKGGHLPSDLATDFLVTRSSTISLVEPFVETGAAHGTGCTLSAALAAGLALGDELEGAARRAKVFITRAISQAITWHGRHGAISALKQW